LEAAVNIRVHARIRRVLPLQSGIQDYRLHIAASFHERLDALNALLGNVVNISRQPTALDQVMQANGCRINLPQILLLWNTAASCTLSGHESSGTNQPAWPTLEAATCCFVAVDQVQQRRTFTAPSKWHSM
jgi:hypothetical protein